MKDPEDEAFEALALRQGQWEHTSGWRKKQVYGKLLVVQDVDISAIRNAVIEEVAQEIDGFSGSFGIDTVHSFSTFVRNMKHE